MSEEGEFKKRIEQFKLTRWLSNPDPDGVGTAAEDALNKITVLEWVDEARKDLVEGSFMQWVSKSYFEDEAAMKYICIEYEKFMKWFGSPYLDGFLMPEKRHLH